MQLVVHLDFDGVTEANDDRFTGHSPVNDHNPAFDAVSGDAMLSKAIARSVLLAFHAAVVTRFRQRVVDLNDKVEFARFRRRVFVANSVALMTTVGADMAAVSRIVSGF